MDQVGTMATIVGAICSAICAYAALTARRGKRPPDERP
jgi:hypothetical protein